MAYQALYRRSRPTTFDDVVGQQHITQTLKNEIVSKRIAHAYLFTGIRGTGKTSTAKIFSRAINCERNSDGNPCNECAVCKGILDGSIMDVIEMDAASNNGVDNIRDLRDEVIYTAAVAKYKVYIIDEVHMLSQGAFNALLKTLEEPPEHVIFILATTEVQKLPATILSRCQRFDFRSITTEDIKGQLSRLASADGIEIDGDAMNVIATMGDGSMRDAISILDRCIAFGQKKLSYKDVINILGAPDIMLCARIMTAVSAGDAYDAITAIGDGLSEGRSPARILDGLLRLARDMMMCKISQDGSANSAVKETAEKFTYEKLVNCIKIFSETSQNMRYASSPRIILETGILKLCMPIYDNSAESVADRLAALEKKVENGVKVVSTAPAEKPKSAAKAEKQVEKKIKFNGKYKEKWQEIVEDIKTKSPGLPGFLNKLTPAGEGDVFMLVASNEDAADKLNFVMDDKFKDIILDSIENVCGTRPLRISFEQNITSQQTSKLIEKIKKFDFVEIYE
ncbi:MAG: DNA polymerase III subunit gamma/tau [Monoglobales bacterium]